MELKRILARDTRSATERAMSLYGPDVLIIANHRVGGQTELVVAVELVKVLVAVAVLAVFLIRLIGHLHQELVIQ